MSKVSVLPRERMSAVERERLLAEVIRSYWRERGYRVKVWVTTEIELLSAKGRVLTKEEIENGASGRTFCMPRIHSDLINGLPRDYRGDLRTRNHSAQRQR